MSDEQKCPKCKSENTYQDMNLWICPDCFFEWDAEELASIIEDASQSTVVKDVNGNVLVSGDSVSVIKDLKVKGTASVVKAGTKVKGIRIIESGDGHSISCKIDGIGAMFLRPEFVKKV